MMQARHPAKRACFHDSATYREQGASVRIMSRAHHAMQTNSTPSTIDIITTSSCIDAVAPVPAANRQHTGKPHTPSKPKLWQRFCRTSTLASRT